MEEVTGGRFLANRPMQIRAYEDLNNLSILKGIAPHPPFRSPPSPEALRRATASGFPLGHLPTALRPVRLHKCNQAVSRGFLP